MPYLRNRDLPASLRVHLPKGAQDIYRAAFNGAWDGYRAVPRAEEIAHRVAWSVVKKSYRKVGTAWIKKAAKATKRRRH